MKNEQGTTASPSDVAEKNPHGIYDDPHTDIKADTPMGWKQLDPTKDVVDTKQADEVQRRQEEIAAEGKKPWQKAIESATRTVRDKFLDAKRRISRRRVVLHERKPLGEQEYTGRGDIQKFMDGEDLVTLTSGGRLKEGVAPDGSPRVTVDLAPNARNTVGGKGLFQPELDATQGIPIVDKTPDPTTGRVRVTLKSHSRHSKPPHHKG